MRLLLRKYFLLATALIYGLSFASFIHAAPITYNFTGVIDYDNNAGQSIGQSVSGFITTDPSTYNFGFQDSTQNYGSGQYYAPGVGQLPLQTSPSQVTGTGISGLKTVKIGGGGYVDTVYTHVARGYQDAFSSNVNWFIVSGFSYELDNTNRGIVIQAYDQLGAATSMFNTPAGDLSLTQIINWSAPGTTYTFSVVEYGQGSIQTYLVGGHLTSMSVVTAVPEPSAVSLFTSALAVLGFVVARKRRHANGAAVV